VSPNSGDVSMLSTDASWVEQLAQEIGGRGGRDEAQSFAQRSPFDYREHTSPPEAFTDIQILRDLVESSMAPDTESPGAASVGRNPPRESDSLPRFVAQPSSDGTPGTFRLRRYSLRRGELSSVFPVIESFGLAVAEVSAYRIAPRTKGEPGAHIEEFVLRLIAPSRDGEPFDPMTSGHRVVATLEAIERGQCDVDLLNQLVITSSLDWRQVYVLRAYQHYLHQVGGHVQDAALPSALVSFPAVARDLVAYFEAQFDPSRGDREAAAALARQRVVGGLAGVPGVEDDDALRSYLGLIDATLRTNYYRWVRDDRSCSTLVLKLGQGREPGRSTQRFWVETFVFSQVIEGIHLRAGPVARGGIRWSSRLEDFRTEIFDLAQAQVRKNAIIVPTGAKGGFICRTHAGVAPTAGEVEEAYRAFIQGLLDVTDNVNDGRAVAPPEVTVLDGEDPYLVVAADKGTATFSDLANEISAEHGFWLGDAFASGGSHGFDHKAMGITSRGAWRAVQSHFRQLGVDVQTESVRIVGIGDMSGDVFGNGMLQSHTIGLVAAFDHRHIFIDPEPDPVLSFAERVRLKDLPYSSWDDYDRSLISSGGGVWPRDMKKISLSPQVRHALGISEEELSGPRLISALLRAPVDLLWMAGIGTYIKGTDEMDSVVGDPFNDSVRITADDVRARIVVEGANLGVTQRARIFYSRRGGRINTDFIDNAAGVATSDREVNLKILLSLAQADGLLKPDERDPVLASAQSDTADEVLRQVDRSVALLNRALAASAEEFDAFQALLDSLTDTGQVNREFESLPDPEEMMFRRANGAGLLRPELAVLLSYTKSDLAQQIATSNIVRGPVAIDVIRPYFPTEIWTQFGHLIARHRLFSELVATILSNEIVDQLGIVWAHETSEELGRDMADVAGSFWAATQTLGATKLWGELETLAPGISSDAEAELHRTVAEAVGALARTFLIQPGPLDPETLIAIHGRLAGELLSTDTYSTLWFDANARDALVRLGADSEVATRFVLCVSLARIGDAGMVARSVGCSATDAFTAFGIIDRVARLDRLVREIRGVGVADRWNGWQARALLDEVGQWRRNVAQKILGGIGENQVLEALHAWESNCSVAFGRSNRLIAELDSPDVDTLTVAALALRSLRAIA
jgi:glutamate dehydrogenase